MQLLGHCEDERERQERIAEPHSRDPDEAVGLWKACSPLLGGLVSSSCCSHPPSHPLTALSWLESRRAGAQVARPHPRQHCRQNAMEARAPRSPAAAARTTVVALRQPPGSYNWAYDLLQVGRGGGKPRKCNLKKRISHSDKTF